MQSKISIERYSLLFVLWSFLMVATGLLIQPGFLKSVTMLFDQSIVPVQTVDGSAIAVLFYVEQVFWSACVLLCAFVLFAWAALRLRLSQSIFFYGAGIACVCVVVKNIFVPPALPAQGYGLMLALNAVSEYLYFMVGEAIGILLVLALKSLLLFFLNPNGKCNGHKNAKHSPEDMTMLVRLRRALCSMGSTKTQHPTKKNKKASSHVN